jgi:hypothetical protein
MQAYTGSVQNPYPPMPGGWAAVGYGDALAATRAAELSQYRSVDGLPALPRWHYHDELLRTGLYRFFAFMSPDGIEGVACCKFVGDGSTHPATLGQDDTTGDGTGGDFGTTTTGATTDSGGNLSTSGDTIQCSSPQVPNAAGTACVNPAGGGGGGGTTPTTPTTPTTAPAQASSSGLVLGILAALAVGGTIIAASAAKHPVRAGKAKKKR